METLTNDTPPKKVFWTPPLIRHIFHPPQVSVLCFSCTKNPQQSRPEALLAGSKNFGRVHSLVRFLSPIRFAPPPYHGPTDICVAKKYPLSPTLVLSFKSVHGAGSKDQQVGGLKLKKYQGSVLPPLHSDDPPKHSFLFWRKFKGQHE